jgi:hypothetical protein
MDGNLSCDSRNELANGGRTDEQDWAEGNPNLSTLENGRFAGSAA